MLTLRDRYARGRVAVRSAVNAVRYDAPPDPYRLLDVNPDRITRRRQFAKAKFAQAGVIKPGDWDERLDRFAESDVYRAYERHFERGVPWTETSFYHRVVDEIEGGRPKWNCESEAEFRTRCERLDELYARIAREGYKSQAELIEADARDPIELDRESRLLTERLKDEIAVHIGRDGELVFADGRNRLSMVKLIGVDSVPVRVLVRHRDWQAVRDAFVRGESWAAAYAGHADLADLEFGGESGP